MVYIRCTAIRRLKLQLLGVQTICIDVKGEQNVGVFICACYRLPAKCKISDLLESCSNAAEQMRRRSLYWHVGQPGTATASASA